MYPGERGDINDIYAEKGATQAKKVLNNYPEFVACNDERFAYNGSSISKKPKTANTPGTEIMRGAKFLSEYLLYDEVEKRKKRYRNVDIA